MKEKVLVVDTDKLNMKLFDNTQFIDKFPFKKKESLKSAYYTDRDEAETDPSKKQIIPYVVLTDDDKVVAYQRSKGDNRLTGKWSVGFGGHINPEDNSCLKTCALREVGEELIISNVTRYVACGVEDHSELVTEDDLEFLGCIYDCSNDVGKVHLGVVYAVDVKNFITFPRESTVTNLSRMPVKEVLELENLETWSRIVLTKANL